LNAVAGIAAAAAACWCGAEATARADEARRPARLLVVTVTTGFRHPSIATAEVALEEMGRSSGLFHVDFLRLPPGRPTAPPAPKRAAGTGDDDWKRQEEAFKAAQEAFRAADEPWQKELRGRFARAFAADALADFDGVVFASTTGDDLPVPDLDAFLSWIKSGKAFIGMHGATDTLKKSDAYRDLVGGAFDGHPWNANGEHAFVVHEPGHRIAAMFPPRFRWSDEIYQYDGRFDPATVRVLVSLDMAASTPKEPRHIPVSWIRNYGSGRVFYTNFGHNDATWKEPMFRRHMTEGIAWAVGRFDAPAAPNPDVQAAEQLRSVAAAAAHVMGRDGDQLRARAEAKIAANPSWAAGLRPLLEEVRALDPAARPPSYARLIAEIEKP
jgi:type 1 glutamine amidotransferase